MVDNGTEPSLRRVASLVRSPFVALRLHAAEQLAHASGPEVVPLVDALLSDQDSGVLLAALTAADRHRPESGWGTKLGRLAAHADARVASAARAMLAEPRVAGIKTPAVVGLVAPGVDLIDPPVPKSLGWGKGMVGSWVRVLLAVGLTGMLVWSLPSTPTRPRLVRRTPHAGQVPPVEIRPRLANGLHRYPLNPAISLPLRRSTAVATRPAPVRGEASPLVGALEVQSPGPVGATGTEMQPPLVRARPAAVPSQPSAGPSMWPSPPTAAALQEPAGATAGPMPASLPPPRSNETARTRNAPVATPPVTAPGPSASGVTATAIAAPARPRTMPPPELALPAERATRAPVSLAVPVEVPVVSPPTPDEPVAPPMTAKRTARLRHLVPVSRRSPHRPRRKAKRVARAKEPEEDDDDEEAERESYAPQGSVDAPLARPPAQDPRAPGVPPDGFQAWWALQKPQELVDIYLVLAKHHLKDRNWDRARYFAGRLESVSPGNPEVQLIRDQARLGVAPGAAPTTPPPQPAGRP